MSDTSLETFSDSIDFAALLEASFEADNLERGDVVTGRILGIDQQGLIIGIDGSPRDGFVARKDIERLSLRPEDYQLGDEVDVTVLRMEDEEGNLVLSVSQARQGEDWKVAEALQEKDEVWHGEVAEANRGGLIILFGNLRGFVPASHVSDLPRGLNEEERKNYLMRLVGQKVPLKVIEVNRKRRRLVFSQRDAQRDNREARKDSLLDELKEGEVRRGIVSGLRDFGAFVDLGGADGLIHISELAWHRVKHPKEILEVGDQVDVYILRLDAEGKRIGLSLKRLQPNPWSMVEELYHVGQVVQGTVSRTAQFGAFISLDPGIEALLHVSQIGDGTVQDATQVIRDGDVLSMRIISIEADKQRLGLSLRDLEMEVQIPADDVETETVETITEEVVATIEEEVVATIEEEVVATIEEEVVATIDDEPVVTA